MFKNTFQSGFLSILYSIGSKPLQIWDKKVTFSNLIKYCRLTLKMKNKLRLEMGISKE